MVYWTVADGTIFCYVLQMEYMIMTKDAFQRAGQRLSVKPESMLVLRWQAIDGLAERIKRHLRPLYGVLDFGGVTPDNPWLAALLWVKDVFATQHGLSARRLSR